MALSISLAIHWLVVSRYRSTFKGVFLCAIVTRRFIGQPISGAVIGQRTDLCEPPIGHPALVHGQELTHRQIDERSERHGATFYIFFFQTNFSFFSFEQFSINFSKTGWKPGNFVRYSQRLS